MQRHASLQRISEFIFALLNRDFCAKGLGPRHYPKNRDFHWNLIHRRIPILSKPVYIIRFGGSFMNFFAGIFTNIFIVNILIPNNSGYRVTQFKVN